MDITQQLSSILIWVVIPWIIWVTKGQFDMSREISLLKEKQASLKEDLVEIKDKLDLLIDRQLKESDDARSRYVERDIPKR